MCFDLPGCASAHCHRRLSGATQFICSITTGHNSALSWHTLEPVPGSLHPRCPIDSTMGAALDNPRVAPTCIQLGGRDRKPVRKDSNARIPSTNAAKAYTDAGSVRSAASSCRAHQMRALPRTTSGHSACVTYCSIDRSCDQLSSLQRDNPLDFSAAPTHVRLPAHTTYVYTGGSLPRQIRRQRVACAA